MTDEVEYKFIEPDSSKVQIIKDDTLVEQQLTNIMRYCAPAEVGVFTKRLISLTNMVMRRASQRPTPKGLDDESARY